MDNSEIGAFFANTTVSIYANRALREPQVEGYKEIHAHFERVKTPCYVQLPVGCGKTGLMGLTPFGLSAGRVLIVTPNLTIRKTVLNELNISDPECFYTKRGVFVPTTGPFVSVLKTGANRHDCDSAHIVVANIQQFARERWFEEFPRDYFHMILVDEGHHNVAETWRRLFEYFDQAKVVSFTATPVRADGQVVLGKRVYSYSYTKSMMMGFISPIDCLHVAPETVTFTADGVTRTIALEEVLKMRENDWFSKGIALSETCNRHIVEASLRQLREVRKLGKPRQIIAATCSIRHARQVAALYAEKGMKVEVLTSRLSKEERDRVEASLRAGITDVVVQVQILGEGYDLGTLSVGAVFRPYRSLSPYIQFVGRILRLADPLVPGSPGNKVYVVSHVGLNDERWWSDFQNFDKNDQEFFAEYLGRGEEQIEGEGETPRLTLRSFMRVLDETVTRYVQRGFLTEIDEKLVDEVLDTIRNRGFDPLEFGLSREMMQRRLEIARLAQKEVVAESTPTQPQQRREALLLRVSQVSREIANVVLNRLDCKHGGKSLLRHFPGRGSDNLTTVIVLAQAALNKAIGAERKEASIEQLRRGIDSEADIADSLTRSLRKALGDGETAEIPPEADRDRGGAATTDVSE